MSSTASKVVEGANDSFISLGYSSLVTDTECENCEKLIAALDSQEKRYNSSVCGTEQQIHNEREQHRKQVETLGRAKIELRDKVRILESHLHQLELGQQNFEIREEENEGKRESVLSQSRAFLDFPSCDNASERAEKLARENKELHLQPKHYFGKELETDQHQNLFQTIANSFLPSDISKFRDWAKNLSLGDIPDEAIDVLFCLDQKEIINVSNLNQLRDFFESILRYDLVYVIDEFVDGNYDVLKEYERINMSSTSEVVEGADDSLVSLGYSSLAADTECKNCENLIAALDFQQKGYNNSICATEQQIHNEREHHREEIEILKRTNFELRDQAQILESQLHRLELGQQNFERREEGNKRKRESVLSQSRAFQDFPPCDNASERAEKLARENKTPHQLPKNCFDKEVETDQYLNLLQTMARSFLPSDISKLRDWAKKLSIGDIPDEVSDVFFCLDQKQIIDASNLHQVRDIFESILRYDLVYVIDEFVDGNYDVLKEYK